MRIARRVFTAAYDRPLGGFKRLGKIETNFKQFNSLFIYTNKVFFQVIENDTYCIMSKIE